MLLGIPAPSPFDLNFRAFGIPVRVHPFFWLGAAVIGWSDRPRDLVLVVACIFVSILVHELGHGLTAKAFGFRPSIALITLGGLCYSEAERQSFGQRLAVLIAGPGAGFALAGLAFAVTLGLAANGVVPGEAVGLVLFVLVWINVVWGLLNLLPVWPLDGGQITGVLLNRLSPWRGQVWTHSLSVLVAGLVAVVAFAILNQMFLGVFFALYAVTNFQMLQGQKSFQGPTVGADDWRR